MTTNKNFKEVTKEEKKKYVLCYVESVPKTYFDLDPKSQILSETDEYKEYVSKRKAYFDEQLAKYHSYSSSAYDEYNRQYDPDGKFSLNYCDYPDPDYKAGFTHYFYFTDNMSKQWGDDWNDAPYEYNAEVPYDSETNIIRIPVRLTYYAIDRLLNDLDDSCNSSKEYDKQYDKLLKKYPNYRECQLKFPEDYGYNSPFCVDDINHGAVAWVYFALYDYGVTDAVAIHGGDSIKGVEKKLKQIDKILKKKIEKK